MMPTARTVLFLCPHGAAKSVIAAADFERLARERGLNFQAAAAGTEPDTAVPPTIVDALKADGLDLSDYRPRRVTAADLSNAAHVVSLGCDLPASGLPEIAVERWDDVPSPSHGLSAAREAIGLRLTDLIERIAADEPDGRGSDVVSI